MILLLCDREQLCPAWSDQRQSSMRTPGRWTVGSGGSALGPHQTGRDSAPVWLPELQQEPGWGGTTRKALRTVTHVSLAASRKAYLSSVTEDRKPKYVFITHHLLSRYVFIHWDWARSFIAGLANLLRGELAIVRRKQHTACTVVFNFLQILKIAIP